MSLETSAKLLVDQVKNAIEHQNPLVIEGGGSKQFYGYPPPDELPKLSV